MGVATATRIIEPATVKNRLLMIAFPRRYNPDQVPRVCSQPAFHRSVPAADTPSDTKERLYDRRGRQQRAL